MATLSLKKARRIDAALQEAVGTAVNSLRYGRANTKIQETEEAALEEAKQLFLAARNQAMLLSEIRSQIRQAIGKANETSGINDLMGKLAAVELQLQTLKGLNVGVEVSYSVEWRDSAVSRTARYSSPTIDSEITSLKFQISELKDRTAGINAQTTIDIDDGYVAVLNTLGIPV